MPGAGAPKQRPTCPAAALQVEGDAEEAEDTLAGVTVGALRNWLRQVGGPEASPPTQPRCHAPCWPPCALRPGTDLARMQRRCPHTQGRELSYQILGLAARLAPEALPGGPDAWAAALACGLPDLHHQHLRLMERHILIPMLQSTPPHARRAVPFAGPACLPMTCPPAICAVAGVKLSRSG